MLNKCEANRRDAGIRFWETSMNCITRENYIHSEWVAGNMQKLKETVRSQNENTDEKC